MTHCRCCHFSRTGGAVIVIVTVSVAWVVLSSSLSACPGHTDVILRWWWHDPGHVDDIVVVACATVAAQAPCHTLTTSWGGGMTQGTSSSLFGGTGGVTQGTSSSSFQWHGSCPLCRRCRHLAVVVATQHRCHFGCMGSAVAVYQNC